MHFRRVTLVVAVLLAASTCGSDDTASPTVTSAPTPTSPATTPVATPDRTTLPTTTTTTPTLVPPPTTTSMTIAFPDDVTLGLPTSHLLEALPAHDIPWDQVGHDWLAVYSRPNIRTDPPRLDERALYLVDPDDRIYAVSALPSDGTVVVSVSWTGRIALLQGGVSQGLGVLDLETTVFRLVVPAGKQPDAVSLTRDGKGLWAYDVPWSNPPQAGGSMRLSRVDLAERTWSTVLEEPVELAELVEYYHWWVNTRWVNGSGGAVELPDGDVVTAFPSGVWIGAPDGKGFRRLDTPDSECSVIGVWDDTHVVVACQVADTEGRSWCGNTGLWLVPTDGQPSTVLVMAEADACTSYSGPAVPVDGNLAVTVRYGPGECNAHVVIVGADGTDHWVPSVEEVRCNEYVLGARDGAWLMIATNPYIKASPMALFEVSPTGDSRVDLPNGWVLPLDP
jgi:hypothetical protein